jgi:hypothetical protein
LTSWIQSGPLGTALPEVGRQNSIGLGMTAIYARPNGMRVTSKSAERQRQLHTDRKASMVLDELPQHLGNLPTSLGQPPSQLSGNFFGSVARLAFGRIERHHAQRAFVLAGEEVTDEGEKVGASLVRLAPRRAVPKILQHQVDVPIQPIGGNDQGD